MFCRASVALARKPKVPLCVGVPPMTPDEPKLRPGGRDPDADQVTVPLCAHQLADQRVRHRVEGPVNFDVPIRVDRARADLEQTEGLARQWLEGGLFDFEEVLEHLLARGAMDAHLRHRAVPALQKRGELLQAIEATTLQCVGFDVPTAAFGDSIFLGMTWA